MIVLDTNIISEPARPAPSGVVMQWLNSQPPQTLYLTTPTIGELSMGANRIFLKTGSKRFSERLSAVIESYRDRLLAFDVAAATTYGDLMARRMHAGKPLPVVDAMIAAICLYHGATLATRNTRDFEGLDLKLVNPFEAA